jgi:hypothetical protein
MTLTALDLEAKERDKYSAAVRFSNGTHKAYDLGITTLLIAIFSSCFSEHFLRLLPS